MTDNVDHKLLTGERVVRPMNVYRLDSPLKHGHVVARYACFGTRFGDYPELYMVLWDSGKLERGFLRHGLQREVDSV